MFHCPLVYVMGYNTVKKMNEFKGILAGLGNPGGEYGHTFHNAGSLFVDFVADGSTWQRPGRRPFEYCLWGKIVLIRPLLYMNESGRAVSSALNYFKLKPAALTVAQDESDLALGDYKISRNRGAAGHKGILSIAKELGTFDFVRIRIGIRARDGKASSFVLKNISPAEKKKLHLVFGDILKLMEKDQLPLAKSRLAP